MSQVGEGTRRGVQDQFGGKMGVLGVRCSALPIIMGCVSQTVSSPTGPNTGDSVTEHAAIPLWGSLTRRPQRAWNTAGRARGHQVGPCVAWRLSCKQPHPFPEQKERSGS